jgi:hypothetical protein
MGHPVTDCLCVVLIQASVLEEYRCHVGMQNLLQPCVHGDLSSLISILEKIIVIPICFLSIRALVHPW